jgi:hypothetical protein
MVEALAKELNRAEEARWLIDSRVASDGMTNAVFVPAYWRSGRRP